eukprot:scaffold48569_cov83-Phaeocystis_antarctica.AAC.1
MAVRFGQRRGQRAFLDISTISHQNIDGERDADRIQGDCNPCQGDYPTVLGVVAIERVVNPQEASAVIKLLAFEGLEGARGDQWEGIEQDVQQIWQSLNQPGFEAGGLALGVDLGGNAANQNKQSKYARRQHEEEQLIEEGAELQAAQRHAKRFDARVQDVEHVEQ